MTTDEKRQNVRMVYDTAIGSLIDALDAMRRYPASVDDDYAHNKHTMTVLDGLIGHLQERRERQIAKVK